MHVRLAGLATLHRSALLALALATAPLHADIAEPSGPPPAHEAEPLILDVPYVPTPDVAVYRMLEMAGVQPDDYVIDLGSGDGRIVIAAARDWGVKKALGIDIDPERIVEANENARKAGVEDRVRFVRGNLFEMDFSDVDVLTMYLLPSINLELRPVILEKLRPGTRIVSHAFDMGEWRPDEYHLVHGRYIYKWVVPARVAGKWRVRHADGRTLDLEFVQELHSVQGTTHEADGRAHPLDFVDVRGPIIRFSLDDAHYTGRVEGDTITALPGNRVVEGWYATRF